MAEDTSLRGQPEAPAAVTTPAAAPEAPASSLQQKQDLTTQVASVNSPQAVRALLAQAKGAMETTLKTKPRDFNGKDEAPKPAEAAPVETPAATTEEAPATTEEAQPETEEAPAQPEATDEAEAGDTDDDDSGDGPVAPISGKRAHLRIPEGDKVGRQALAYMKRNRDMTLEEAMSKARETLGIKPEKAAAEETPKAPENPDLPDSPEATKAAIARLRAERKKANTELNFELASELSDKLEDLIRHDVSLERQGERKQTEAATKFNSDFDASEAKAVSLYEFAGKPDSDGGKRMAEIDAMLKENDDPLFYSPDKPLRIAQMVAAEKNIAPRKKGTAPAPAKPAAAPAVPAPKKGILPSGGSRTTPPPTNQPPAINAQVQKIQSVHELRQLRKSLGLSI